MSKYAQMPPENTSGLLGSYLFGFVLSIGFSLVAYYGATRHWLTGGAAVVALLGLAILQFVVQLFFFLHIGRETRPRWKLLMLFLAIVFVLIVVLGSVWIMYNLNYRMSPQQMEEYMMRQDGGV